MKGIVVEINKKNMVIMKQNGEFIKEKIIKGVDIGQEVSISEQSKAFKSLYRFSLIAATFMLFIFGGLQFKLYYTPYGYLNLDINPSIVVEYNKFERVLNARGLNDDGNVVISHTKDLTNDRLESAITDLVKTANESNYLVDNEENQILLSTYSPDIQISNEVQEKVNKSVNDYLSKLTKKAEIMKQVVSKEDIERAQTQNISVGKLKLYEKAKQVDSTITMEDVKNKSVRETVKLIKEKQKIKGNNKDKEKNSREDSKEVGENEDKDTSQSNQIMTSPNIYDSPKKSNTLQPSASIIKDSIESQKDNKKSAIENKEKINQTPKIESHERVKDKINKIQERIKNINNKTKRTNN